MKRMPARRWVLPIGLLLLTDPAGAEYEPTYLPQLTISRAAGEIRIDGVLDDPGWEGAATATGFAEHQPGDQVRPPVDTRAHITYDDENLYVGFVCHDDPAAVRASLCERDRIFEDDMVFLLLDTYGDQSWAYEIAANPYGIQGDLLWSAGGGEDMSYDLIYDSAGRITDEGYVVEFAIPFSSLRFPGGQEQVWRVDFWRNHPRDVRGQYSWAAYDRDDPCWPCQWGTAYGLRDLRPGRGLELLPSLVTTQAGARDDEGRFQDGDLKGQVSLGAKYALSSSITAEATYNPDFSQVESDAAQIDVNTPFALFYPERRPFFQEGSDLFQTWFNVVYTRSINDPRYSAKLTGRPGRTNVAFLSALDEHSPYLIPLQESSELVTAGRSVSNILRVRQSLGEASHLGIVGTDRRREGGGAGTVLGGDAALRLDARHRLELQVLASRTAEPDAPGLTADLDPQEFDDGAHTLAFDGESYWGHALYASFERESRSLFFDLEYWERSPSFRTENGFEFRNDRREGHVSASYVFYRDGSFLDRIQPSVNAARVWNFDGLRKDEWLGADLQLRLKWARSSVHANGMVSNELYHDVQFEDIWGSHVCAQVYPADAFRAGFYLNYGHRIARGDLVMGRQLDGGLWFDLKPLDRLLLETSVDYIRSRDLDTGLELFEGYILRSRWGLQLNRELAARVVLQFDDFDQRWEADPLLSYRINPFSIFYVGSTRDYEELSAAEHGVEGWKLTDRQYFLKLQYLFQI